MPFVLSSVAVVAASLGAGECARGGDRKTSPPLALGALDSRDYAADQVVVDFKDGTTKALYDALEKAWGIDAEFNSIEGALDGITVGHVDASRRDAVLEHTVPSPVTIRSASSGMPRHHGRKGRSRATVHR